MYYGADIQGGWVGTNSFHGLAVRNTGKNILPYKNTENACGEHYVFSIWYENLTGSIHAIQ